LKKILLLTNSIGGLYNFRFELIKKILSKGYDVYICAPQPIENNKANLMINNGAKYIQTLMKRRGVNPFGDLKLAINYMKIVRQVNPDIVLTFTVKPNIYGAYAAIRHNKPVIMNITGLGSSQGNRIVKNIVKQLYKYVCNRTELIFFQNRENKSYFVLNGIAKQDKTRLIPGSGVNIAKFVPLAKERQDETIRFLFIGRIMKEKGIEEYLRAAEEVSQHYPNAEFQILGSFEEQKYRNIIENNKSIVYLGISKDVRNEIKEVDCIVHPSYHEGMSNVLLEGAAMGKPLIASNIPGCKEIIEDGHNGYLFEVRSIKNLKDKLIQFIRLDKEAREAMGKNSRKKVEAEFDRNTVVNEYIEAIQKILNKGENNGFIRGNQK
jgi:glycosyltransferase involved in cell wall biosynthesis